jgi:hypothetical protein
MVTLKNEMNALQGSFSIYGKVLIAVRQFGHELSDHLYNLFLSRRSEFEQAGIKLGQGKAEGTWDNPGDRESYIGILIPITSFKGLIIDNKTKLYIELVYNLQVAKEADVFPYAALTIYYPGNAQNKKSGRRFLKLHKKISTKIIH